MPDSSNCGSSKFQLGRYGVRVTKLVHRRLLLEHMHAHIYACITPRALHRYHALCAPSKDPTWAGSFDPADQPQQMAMTTGFACIAACSTNGRNLGAESMKSIFQDPVSSRDSLCGALPWMAVDFTNAISFSQLAKMSAPLLHQPCACLTMPS